MPLYPYRCRACEFEFEEFQLFSEDPLVRCPSCGKKKLRRVFTVPNVVVRFNPKSVLGLAEQNTRDLERKLGKEQAAAHIRSKVRHGKGKKAKLPAGATIPKDPGPQPLPWYRNGEHPHLPKMEKPLDVRKVKDPVRYILKGDKD